MGPNELVAVCTYFVYNIYYKLVSHPNRLKKLTVETRRIGALIICVYFGQLPDTATIETL